MLGERVGVVGAELRLHQRQRLLEERQGPVELAGGLVAAARLFMLVSVSGWSGPSFAFLSASVSSKSGRARSSLPAVLVADGEVVHAGERVGVVGAELRLPQRQRLLEERQGAVELAGGLVARGEVVHAGERVGVVGAELRLRQRQRLLEQRQGAVELAGGR